MHPLVRLLQLSLPAEQVIYLITQHHVKLIVLLALSLTLFCESYCTAVVFVAVVVHLTIHIQNKKALLLNVQLISLQQDSFSYDVVVALARDQVIHDLKVMLAVY